MFLFFQNVHFNDSKKKQKWFVKNNLKKRDGDEFLSLCFLKPEVGMIENEITRKGLKKKRNEIKFIKSKNKSANNFYNTKVKVEQEQARIKRLYKKKKKDEGKSSQSSAGNWVCFPSNNEQKSKIE